MNKRVGELVAGKLDIAFPSCEIRQCTQESPVIYRGPGLLTQSKDRCLVLKVFAEKTEPAVAIDRCFRRDFTPGVLVPDARYYDFSGTDNSGVPWSARRVSINENFGEGTIVTVSPFILESSVPCQVAVNGGSVVAFVEGELKLPWHAAVDMGELGRATSRFEGKSGRFGWTVTRSEDGAWLNFNCDAQPAEDPFDAFLRGLSIVAGRRLTPFHYVVREAGSEKTMIRNCLHVRDESQLHPPIHAKRDAVDDVDRFLGRWIEASVDSGWQSRAACDLAHRFWYRILRCHLQDLENSALVLAVALEGLVKETQLSQADVDREFVGLAESARPILDALDINQRVKSCVLQRLEALKRPRIQGTFRRLQSTGLIDKEHRLAWENLRHAGAHGAVLDGESDSELQAKLDGFHVCLAFFYRLIFQIIGYEGQCIAFDVQGWPTGKFRPVESLAPGTDNCPGGAELVATKDKGRPT